jgi:hypothetical protein
MGSSPLAQSQPESPVTQVISKPKRSEDERMKAIRGLENELLEECISVSRDALRAKEIDPTAEAPPQEWIDEMGLERASEAFRCAKAGWDTKKNAPIFVQIAASLGVGIMKSRATEKTGSRTINATIVQFPVNQPPEKPYPVIDLPPEER